MNNKAELTVGNIVISFIILGLILTLGFSAYDASLSDVGITPESLNTTGLAQLRSENDALVEEISASKENVTAIGNIDVLTMGLGSIKAVFRGIVNTPKYVSYMQTETELSFLGKIFWTTVESIISILIIFVIIGAIWRWNMK